MGAGFVQTARIRHLQRQLRMHLAVAIVAYGDSAHLDQCAASLVSQRGSFSDMAITTSTPSPFIAEIARKHSVRLVVNPARLGIGADWNFALRAVDGDIVVLAHQDDSYFPNYASIITRIFESNRSIVLAFTNFKNNRETQSFATSLNRIIKATLCELAFLGRRRISSRRAKRRLLYFGNPVCCPSAAINMTLARNFEFDTELQSNLDWDAWLRLAEMPGAFAYIRRALVLRRIHPSSETARLVSNSRRMKEDRLIFEKLWPRRLVRPLMALYRLGYKGA